MTDEFNKIWSRENCVQLAKLLEQHPCLWCRADENYKKKAARYDAIQQIAQELCLTHLEVDAKIKIIIGQFQREMKRGRKIRTGSDSDERYTSRWFLFKHLKFLATETAIRRNVSASTPLENLIIEIRETENHLQESVDYDVSAQDSIIETEEPERILPDFPRDSFPHSGKAYKRKSDDNDISKTAFSLANRLSAGNEREEDEWDTFGALVAKKIRACKDPLLQLRAENEINAALFKMKKNEIEGAGYRVITPMSNDND